MDTHNNHLNMPQAEMQRVLVALRRVELAFSAQQIAHAQREAMIHDRHEALRATTASVLAEVDRLIGHITCETPYKSETDANRDMMGHQ